jgi:hypothetical protein
VRYPDPSPPRVSRFIPHSVIFPGCGNAVKAVTDVCRYMSSGPMFECCKLGSGRRAGKRVAHRPETRISRGVIAGIHAAFTTGT